MQRTKLSDYDSIRENNFDFIRFLAAVLVIHGHAFLLNTSEEYLDFATIAVYTFFAISGFLITKSYTQSNNPIYYFKSRVLRIFPALIIVVTLTTFILGPLVSRLTFLEYFSNIQTYDYLKSMLLFDIQYDLPGVFETNGQSTAVNGSLWTLWFEFVFYILVMILGYFKLLNKKVILTLFILSSVHYFLSIPYGDYYNKVFKAFVAGMMMYSFRNYIPLNGLLAFISFVILISTKILHLPVDLFYIFGTYLVFYLSFVPRVGLSSFGKYGDFSYGIYIYAFPIQQTIIMLFDGKMNPYLNILITIPITLFFAVLSWKLIEKPALKMKGRNLQDSWLSGIVIPKSEVKR